jgi:hypothetical protein
MNVEQTYPEPGRRVVDLRKFSVLTGMIASLAAAVCFVVVNTEPHPAWILAACGPFAVFGFVVSSVIALRYRWHVAAGLVVVRSGIQALAVTLPAGLLTSTVTGALGFAVLGVLGVGDGGLMDLALTIGLPCVATGIVMPVLASWRWRHARID